MIEHFVAQGSDEWKACRAGVITASNFHLIRASKRLKSGPNKGDYSEAAKAYAFRLAIERISGLLLDEGFETWAMSRGHELEPAARAKHEDLTGDLVREVGFISTDDNWYGGSADGFRMSNDNGCEYKCFIAPDKLRSILIDGSTEDVIDQCQGGMWLSGAKAWEFGLYCPALESIGRDFTLIVIERDDDYIEALEQDLLAFRELVMSYEATLRAGPALPRQEFPGFDNVPPWLPSSITTPAAVPATFTTTADLAPMF